LRSWVGGRPPPHHGREVFPTLSLALCCPRFLAALVPPGTPLALPPRSHLAAPDPGLTGLGLSPLRLAGPCPARSRRIFPPSGFFRGAAASTRGSLATPPPRVGSLRGPRGGPGFHTLRPAVASSPRDGPLLPGGRSRRASPSALVSPPGSPPSRAGVSTLRSGARGDSPRRRAPGSVAPCRCRPWGADAPALGPPASTAPAPAHPAGPGPGPVGAGIKRPSLSGRCGRDHGRGRRNLRDSRPFQSTHPPPRLGPGRGPSKGP